MRDSKIHWDKKYQTPLPAEPAPAQVLTDYRYLLPKNGKALDLACGRGGNALFLARAGLDSHAWDISAVALRQLDAISAQQKLRVHTEMHDLETHPPSPASFDVIVISHYLERRLCRTFSEALRPGGLLFYQTFSRDPVSMEGPCNPNYRLAAGELLTLFADLQALIYRDEGRVGDPNQGFRNQAMLVAAKPST